MYVCQIWTIRPILVASRTKCILFVSVMNHSARWSLHYGSHGYRLQHSPHLKALSVCLSFCSGSGYLDPTTAAGIISNLTASGTLAGFNLWNAAFDAENNLWSSRGDT
jgi:hypothetical protein